MTANLTLEGNRNYAAQVVTMPAPRKHPNADRLEIFDVLGMQLIASTGTYKEGEIAVVFGAETQLSEILASEANLLRRSEMNKNPEVKGYLEDNRRVRAMKLRGQVSSALTIPEDEFCLIFGLTQGENLKPGTRFDHVNGVEVCRKYEIVTPQPRFLPEDAKRKKAFKRVDEAIFPQHLDTDNFFRASDGFTPADLEREVIVTQKLHGSSVRLANIPVKRKLTWLERIVQKLGVKVQAKEYDTIAGSRRVVKDANNPDAGFYKSDIWSDALEAYDWALTEGYIIYGELVGYIPNGGPIQRGYTYEEPEGEYQLYVYRVAAVVGDDVVDLSWDQVKQFCAERDLNWTPELWRGKLKDFDWSQFEDKDYFHEYVSAEVGSFFMNVADEPVRLSGSKTVDEGVVIRLDRGAKVPYLTKAKSPQFLLHETQLLDEGVTDMESVS